METDKNGQRIIEQAIEEWTLQGKLTEQQAAGLRATIHLKAKGQHIAQYFFFIALFCTLMAFGVLFLNEKLLEKIKAYFSWSDFTITIITAGMSALWLWYVNRKRQHISTAAFEVDMALGAMAVLTSLLYCCKALHLDKTYTAFLSITLCVMLLLATIMRSRALWILSMIIAIGWFGSWTTWLELKGLFLGMNYPVRYTVFGFLILGIYFLHRRMRLFAFTGQFTYIGALTLIFCGFWGMSIFGNFASLAEWQQVPQSHVLVYAIVFGLASATSFYLGVKYDDDLARDFAILFLIINLYTRYFEYFWDTMNKGIFFLILAITFGLVGWWLERRSRKAVKRDI